MTRNNTYIKSYEEDVLGFAVSPSPSKKMFTRKSNLYAYLQTNQNIKD